MKRDLGGEGHTMSTLSVSSNGSNWVKLIGWAIKELRNPTFSILERIELGETPQTQAELATQVLLSVSSNGSNWVKLVDRNWKINPLGFQYPRTDRIG